MFHRGHSVSLLSCVPHEISRRHWRRPWKREECLASLAMLVNDLIVLKSRGRVASLSVIFSCIASIKFLALSSAPCLAFFWARPRYPQRESLRQVWTLSLVVVSIVKLETHVVDNQHWGDLCISRGISLRILDILTLDEQCPREDLRIRNNTSDERRNRTRNRAAWSRRSDRSVLVRSSYRRAFSTNIEERRVSRLSPSSTREVYQVFIVEIMSSNGTGNPGGSFAGGDAHVQTQWDRRVSFGHIWSTVDTIVEVIVHLSFTGEEMTERERWAGSGSRRANWETGNFLGWGRISAYWKGRVAERHRREKKTFDQGVSFVVQEGNRLFTSSSSALIGCIESDFLSSHRHEREKERERNESIRRRGKTFVNRLCFLSFFLWAWRGATAKWTRTNRSISIIANEMRIPSDKSLRCN